PTRETAATPGFLPTSRRVSPSSSESSSGGEYRECSSISSRTSKGEGSSVASVVLTAWGLPCEDFVECSTLSASTTTSAVGTTSWPHAGFDRTQPAPAQLPRAPQRLGRVPVAERWGGQLATAVAPEGRDRPYPTSLLYSLAGL